MANDSCLLFSIISFLGSCAIFGLLIPTYGVVVTLIGGLYLFGCYTHISTGTIQGTTPSSMSNYCQVSYSYIDYRENVYFHQRVMQCAKALEPMTVYYNHFNSNKHVITKDMYMNLEIAQGLFISGCIALGLTVGIIITMFILDKNMRRVQRIVPMDIESNQPPNLVVIPMKRPQPEPPIKKYIFSE